MASLMLSHLCVHAPLPHRLKQAKGESEAERIWRACGIPLVQFASSALQFDPLDLRGNAMMNGLLFLAPDLGELGSHAQALLT